MKLYILIAIALVLFWFIFIHGGNYISISRNRNYQTGKIVSYVIKFHDQQTNTIRQETPSDKIERLNALLNQKRINIFQYLKGLVY